MTSITKWDDLRGAVGFGPSLTASGTVLRNGSTVDDFVAHTDGTSRLASALVPLFDLSSAKALVVVYGGKNAGNTFPCALDNADDSTLLGVALNAALQGAISAYKNPPGGSTDSGVTQTSRRRTILVSASGTTIKIWVGQHPVVSATIVTPPAGNIGLTLGAVATGLGLAADFRAAYVLPREPTSADVLTALRWGAAYHGSVDYGPYMVVCDGDSNTFGAGLSDHSTRWPSVLMENPSLALWADENTGVGGAQVISGGNASRLDNLSSGVLSFFPSGVGLTKSVVIFGGGVGGNDIDPTLGNIDGTTTAQNILTYAQNVKAAGKKIIISSLIPRGVPSAQSTYDSRVAAANAYLAAHWAGTADAFVDLSVLAAFSSPTNYSNATYYQGDQVHVTPTSHTELAGAYATALLAL